MKLPKTHKFRTDEIQKNTLIILDEKYKINVSNFIRQAIKEKLEREKETIFKKYKEVKSYLKKINECPF